MIKSNQRVALTKRLLKEGLLRLLETKPIDKINVTELCKESGINRATFYRHYELPRDVLIDMQMDFVNELRQFCEDPLTIKASKQYLENLCAFLFEHSDLIKIFIRYNSEEDLTRALNDFFKDILKLKRNSEELSSLDDESIKLISTYLAGGGYFLMRQWLTDDIQKTPEEIADLVWKLINKDYVIHQ